MGRHYPYWKGLKKEISKTKKCKKSNFLTLQEIPIRGNVEDEDQEETPKTTEEQEKPQNKNLHRDTTNMYDYYKEWDKIDVVNSRILNFLGQRTRRDRQKGNNPENQCPQGDVQHKLGPK